MKKKFSPRFLFLVGLLTASSTGFSDTSWNVPSGDWTVDGNWTAGAPTTGVPATIDNSGTATLSGAAGTSDILKVGDTQNNNGLIITNSGSLSSVSGQIGATVTSASNSVTVSAGGVLNNQGLLFIGGDGSNNTLTITGGGSVITGAAIIGNGALSSGNSVVLTGTGSSWTMPNLLFVGGAGSGNSLTVSAGATLSTGGFELGDQSTSSNNTAALTGAGSTWTVGGAGYVGASGTGNQLTISSGAVMDAQGNGVVIGVNTGADNNAITVTGTGSSLQNVNVLTVGDNGVGNSLAISDGASVTDARGVISGSAGSNGNSVTVTGTGSSWTNTAVLFVGSSGTGNSLTISSGATVTTGTTGPDSSFIGYNLGANNNTATVNGGTWTNAGQLTLGNFGSTNSLVIENGGVVSDTNGLVAYRANSTGNTVLVTGTGSQWNNSGFLYIGRQGNSNTLTISNGAVVTVSGSDAGGFSSAIGFKGTADGNSVLVTGTGSAWNNTAGLAIGEQTTGTNNSLTVADGGNVSAAFIMIGGSAGSSGALNIGNGGNAGTLTTSFITSGLGSGTVNFNHSDTITFSTPIEGNLSVNQIGTGVTILTSSNSYTGNTTISGGVLQVDGSIASPETIINAGGTLGGHGFIGGNVTNGGNVSFNEAPGTLTIGGNYTQTSAGTLTIQVAGTGGANDLLAVNGNAALSGTLQVVRLSNFHAKAGTMVTILTAGGGVAGAFSTVADTQTTILGVDVIYQPNDVVLEFVQTPFTGLPGLTPNEFAVASALDGVVKDPRTAGLIEFLDNEPLGKLPGDFNLIAPEELTAIFDISFAFADVQISNIETRLEEVRDQGATPEVTVANVSFQDGKSMVDSSKDDGKKSAPPAAESADKWNIFMAGSGDFVRVSTDFNAPGYNFTTGGVTLGADYRVCDHLTVGIMGGYADTGATLTQNGSVDVNSGRFGLYSTAYGSGFYMNTLVAGGYNSYDTHRIGLGGLAQGSTDGGEFDGMIGGGYDWHQGNYTFGPIASLQYTYVGINGFNETGSLAPLHIEDQDQNSLRSQLGFRVSSHWKAGNALVTPSLSAAWQHEYLDTTYALDSSFASGAGNIFTVHGPALGRDAAVVKAGISVQWTPRFGTYIYYDGELGRKNYQLNAVSGGARVSF